MATYKATYDQKLLDNISKMLLAKAETVAVAESVTAGHLQAGFSQAKDAMKFFQGGITAYNLGQKSRHFHVDPIHALNCNCVSPVIAFEMAKKAAELFSSDWGIGITGYASRDPNAGINNLFAYFALCYRGDNIVTEKIKAKALKPLQVQLFYTDCVYRHFYELVEIR